MKKNIYQTKYNSRVFLTKDEVLDVLLNYFTHEEVNKRLVGKKVRLKNLNNKNIDGIKLLCSAHMPFSEKMLTISKVGTMGFFYASELPNPSFPFTWDWIV